VSRTSTHEENVGHGWIGSTRYEIGIVRQASLSEDLTQVTEHICRHIVIRILISGMPNDPQTEIKGSPANLAQLAEMILAANAKWSDPVYEEKVDD
jgi:hypothetical protein